MPHCRVLAVHGGWGGHEPERAMAAVLPLLTARGCQVTRREDLDCYADLDFLLAHDLIVQCWTAGRLTAEQCTGLRSAVAAGVGLAGWHGGIIDSFRFSTDYLQLIGGQFVAHPGGLVDYTIDLVDDPTLPGAEIVAGLPHSLALQSEQYWVLSDDYNDVLATTTLPVRESEPWTRPVVAPAIWTRQWGQGRIFVTTVGHTAAELDLQPFRTILDRGMAWAAR